MVVVVGLADENLVLSAAARERRSQKITRKRRTKISVLEFRWIPSWIATDH